MDFEDILSGILASVFLLACLVGLFICLYYYLKHEHKLDIEYKQLRNKALKKYLGVKDESDII